jgi:hypothetical protein
MRLIGGAASCACVLGLMGFVLATSGCGKRGDGTTFEDETDAGPEAGPPVGALFDGGALPGITADAACASVAERAIATPLNLYVMFEKSNSLVGVKWQAATAGLDGFVHDPGSVGIRVALNFFPRTPDAVPACDQNAYKAPRVPFALLPANAQAITTAVQQEQPDGFSTPIYPALGGALLSAYEQMQQRPGESGAVLIVTDGEPQGPGSDCGGVDPNQVASSESLASKALTQLGVHTYVIGLPGVNPTAMNRIAAAGGSGAAYLVATTNVQADFQKGLEAMRGQALPCEYTLPAKLKDKQYTYDRVNVALTSNGATATVPQSADCAADGWQYDDRGNPSKILLCPATCASLRADYKASIEILLGCATIIK